MTTVRLAASTGPPKAFAKGFARPENYAGEDPYQVPALLVSYFYMRDFRRYRPTFCFRNWVLDSGAFSAHNSGATIDNATFLAEAKQMLRDDPQLVEVFSLDVIGDWKQSLKNCEAAWAMGVPAIPTYHVGEPKHVLMTMARDYPKIALGGAVGYRKKDAWAQACFSAVWPKPIHGLGFGSESSIMAVPWHSVDATNWEVGPCKFGSWRTYGKMSVRGGEQNLKAEVDWYLKLEKRARHRWRHALAELQDPPHTPVTPTQKGPV